MKDFDVPIPGNTLKLFKVISYTDAGGQPLLDGIQGVEIKCTKGAAMTFQTSMLRTILEWAEEHHANQVVTVIDYDQFDF